MHVRNLFNKPEFAYNLQISASNLYPFHSIITRMGSPVRLPILKFFLKGRLYSHFLTKLQGFHIHRDDFFTFIFKYLLNAFFN